MPSRSEDGRRPARAGAERRASRRERVRRLWAALRAERVPALAVAFAVVLVAGGLLVHSLEKGGNPQFRRPSDGLWWAIVTLTTVGYGDIAPRTPLGQAIASAIMILGYAIIAIPTGIVSAEIARQDRHGRERACAACGAHAVPRDARFCPHCGEALKRT